MLGGYGVPGPVGNAAFLALRDAGLFERGLAEASAAAGMTEVLARPLPVGGGRFVRYRFHQQRPVRLAAALAQLGVWEHLADGLADRDLRDQLLSLPGVGPKTASWVVRNFRGSDEVAVVDVHIQRAGVAAGAFCPSWTVQRDYMLFEESFLTWARAGAVSAADLDATIWWTLSTLGRSGRAMLADRSASKSA